MTTDSTPTPRAGRTERPARPAEAPVEVDLSDVQALLQQAQSIVDATDGFTFDNRGAHKDSDKAKVRRDLLVLTHLLQRAAVEVDAVSWATRGYADPLRPPLED